MKFIIKKFFQIKNHIKKLVIKVFYMVYFKFIRYYHKFLSIFLPFKKGMISINFSETPVKIKDDALDLPEINLNRLYPTYVFIQKLDFHPKLNLHKMKEFKSLLKWKVLNLDYPLVMRNYPLKFSSAQKVFKKEKLKLRVPPKLLCVEKGDFYIPGSLGTYEEIVTVMPYVKKGDKRKFIKVPLIKEPLIKHCFSREEIKNLREKIAQQNKTSWVNIQIFEIYDKFCPNLYVNIRQASGSKSLECYLSSISENKNPKKNYYLVIGQRRDNGQSIKAIVDPSDIKKAEYS